MIVVIKMTIPNFMCVEFCSDHVPIEKKWNLLIACYCDFEFKKRLCHPWHRINNYLCIQYLVVQCKTNGGSFASFWHLSNSSVHLCLIIFALKLVFKINICNVHEINGLLPNVRNKFDQKTEFIVAFFHIQIVSQLLLQMAP